MKPLQGNGYCDVMLRETRAHHVGLSTMVDTKSNMLLTMSSIIITLAIPRLTDPKFRVAAVILMLSCLTTITLSCVTVMPKLRRKKTQQTPNLVANPKSNPLFFADFSVLNYDQYQDQMHEILKDPTACYEAQVREIYLLGQYLAHNKFPLLRAAYLVFFSGFILAVLQLAWVLIPG